MSGLPVFRTPLRHHIDLSRDAEALLEGISVGSLRAISSISRHFRWCSSTVIETYFDDSRTTCTRQLYTACSSFRLLAFDTRSNVFPITPTTRKFCYLEVTLLNVIIVSFVVPINVTLSKRNTHRLFPASLSSPFLRMALYYSEHT